MTTLEDLYYGNISPCERNMKRGSRMDKLVKLICKNEEDLMPTLTEHQKETFDKFKECQSEICDLTARRAFRWVHLGNTDHGRGHGRYGNGGRDLTSSAVDAAWCRALYLLQKIV